MNSNKLLVSAVLAIAIATTITARAADRSQLEKLVENSTSDLSALTESEIHAAAQLDAELYFKRRGTKDFAEAASIGKGHALNHRLLGQSADGYGAEFASALDSLAKAQADETPTAVPGQPSNLNEKPLTHTPYSKTNSDSRFFAGVQLGMNIKQVFDYYKKFGNVGAMKHSGALAGQEEVDFRNDTVPQRRVYIDYRKSDGKVLSVIYWKLGENETFSNEELQALIRLNSGNGPLTTKLLDKSEFLVTTPKQYRIQQSE
jgi:hypothetical protein